MRFPIPLSIAALAGLITFALAGAAFARETVRPARPVAIPALRQVVEHYRTLTWTFERAASVQRTPTSFSYRHSVDREYLQWTIDTWTRRASLARDAALRRVHTRLAVAIPKPPLLHSSLSRRVSYTRRLTLELRHIYPGTVTKRFAQAHGKTGPATLRLWQRRLAAATLQVLQHGHRPLPRALTSAFQCIHHYEGAWDSNTGNGYYGGLQMDRRFQSLYGADFVAKWGTADNWPAWAQLQVAVRAYRAGRGFYPWPNTARACGLI
ncbi:MAG: transglycosylase family protein [Gaiellaceae bacterium]